MSFRTHMWHKTIDYHFSAFGFRACACFNPNRPLGRNDRIGFYSSFCSKNTKTANLCTIMAPPSVYSKSVVRTYWRTTFNDVHVPAQNRNICQKIANKRSEGCHFGRNAYPFRPKLISLSAETEVLLHRKKVTRRLKFNRTSNLNRQKTWNYSDFSPKHKFHFVLQSPIDIVYTKKKREGDNHQLCDYRLLTNIISYIQEITLS